MHLNIRNIGINFDRDGRAIIKVWAPLADAVQILVEEKYRTLDLVKMPHGYWSLETDQVFAEDLYWIVVNGEKLPDPASLAQPKGVHGPSMAVDLLHNTDPHDESWTNYPLNDYIIYELHTGTFSEAGTFEGIIEHLDHLIALGINAIELMPIAAFPGDRNWGYDGVFPHAVHESYGGAKGLKLLVKACHDKGIAVILDVVYNHLGPEGNYLPKFGNYFTEKYHTPWGSAINYDDSGCDGVREYFIENALMWFRDFHIDALRLDAVHAIKDLGAVHLLQEISNRTALLSAQTGRIHYLIAESDLNDPRYISELQNNGLGMDSQWIDEFHHALRVTAGEPKKGYYSDFNGIEDLAKSYKDAYVYTGTFSEERNRTFGKEATGHPGKQFIVFSQNHDQIGNRMLGERSSMLYSPEMLKLLAAAVFSAPYLPMLFMGEEWGSQDPFLYFVSHTDPELVELVRKGRKEEFAAMHNEGEAPDPQSEETFRKSKLDWAATTQSKNLDLLNFYKTLIQLRKAHLCLKMCDRDATHVHLFKEQNCLILERGLTGSMDLVLCFLNFSKESQNLPVPKGVQLNQMLLNSSSVPNLIDSNLPTENHPTTVNAQPESFTAYLANYV
jgi:maltooligosyltrehalose trehalohydrolase